MWPFLAKALVGIALNYAAKKATSPGDMTTPQSNPSAQPMDFSMLTQMQQKGQKGMDDLPQMKLGLQGYPTGG